MTKSDTVFGEEDDDRPRPAHGVHPLVERPQLPRAELELHKAQRGAETTAASLQFDQPSRAICRRISSARQSGGVSSHSVEVRQDSGCA